MVNIEYVEEEIKKNNERLQNFQKQEEQIKIAMHQTVGVLHALTQMKEKFLSENEEKKKK